MKRTRRRTVDDESTRTHEFRSRSNPKGFGDRLRGEVRAAAAVLAFCLVMVGVACESGRDAPVGDGRLSLDGVGDDSEERFAVNRIRMVERLRNEMGIHDEKVLEAVARVPRHLFVHERYRSRAYVVDTPLRIDEDQTISAPDVVAIMTQALALTGDEKVLEIGTGSGYQAAVLGELAREVYSIEIRPALAESARARLRELKARGVLNERKIEIIVGDGYKGYAAAKEYDAIIVTAAPKQVPTELLNQLKIGGRMVIPVGDFYQELQVITKIDEGQFNSRKITNVRFVPMVREVDGEARE